MHILRPILPLAAALTLVASEAQAADAQHGLDLAKRWCAECHIVAADQRSGSADVPPFSAIAKTSDFDARRLAYFLLEPHPKMPELPLSRAAADDIATYIQSLKQ
jgi:mono/diheme cytochrome c family protein